MLYNWRDVDRQLRPRIRYGQSSAQSAVASIVPRRLARRQSLLTKDRDFERGAAMSFFGQCTYTQP